MSTYPYYIPCNSLLKGQKKLYIEIHETNSKIKALSIYLTMIILYPIHLLNFIRRRYYEQ